jgi:hypothetical protein
MRRPFEQRRRQTAAKLAALMLANAFIFQEQLSGVEAQVRPIRYHLARRDFMGEIIAHWTMIIDTIDYIPIFKVARDILLAMPGDIDTERAMRNLARRSLEIVSKRAALRHDLMGRIYHLLLIEAKYLGTYYTSVPAATLLLKLALDIDRWETSWSDLNAINEFRIADLACGTGTLLMAASQAITDNLIRTKAANGESVAEDLLTRLHTTLVEETLYGYDVLPSAVHLTASTLAMLAPETCFRRMHLYSLPLGRMQSGQMYLGSIDYISASLIQTQLDLMGRTEEAEDVAQEDLQSVARLPDLDLCVMNPPFVRSVGGNLLFGSLPEYREEMKQELSERMSATNLPGSVTAGLGSVFTAIGDRHVKPGGRLALVLPAAVTTGVAWERTRDVINSGYVLETLISSHHPDRWNFSENTDLSEVLVIARKRNAGETNISVAQHPTHFINLWQNPTSSAQALAIAEVVARGAPAPLERDGQPFPGITQVTVGSDKYGESIEIPWDQVRSRPWLGACFAQTELVRAVWFIRSGRLFLPGRPDTVAVEIVKLGDLGTLGPDRRDIHDGYELSQSRTNYPAYWGHDSNTVRTMAAQPNRWLSPRSTAAPKRKAIRNPTLLWSRAGAVMLAERMWLITQRLLAVRLPQRALSNVWWPFWMNEANEEAEKALVLWLNSTLGIMTVFGHRVPTRGPWVEFKKPVLAALPVLNVCALQPRQLSMMAGLYDQVSERELGTLQLMETDETRIAIDIGIAQIIGLPDLTPLRTLLGQEPIVCGTVLGSEALPNERGEVQLEFELL